MALSANQILQLIKKHSKVFNTNKHSELDEIGTLTHDELELAIVTPIIVLDDILANIEVSLATQAKHVLDIDDDIDIELTDLPVEATISKVIVLTLLNTSGATRTISWTGCVATDWADEDMLTELEDNKKYLVSIITCVDGIEINYITFNLPLPN